MRVRLKQDRLLDMIARSNLSQNHWAIKLGLSRGHWSDLVNGKHPYPSARTRERLLEAFKVPFDELFEPEVGTSGLSDHNFQAAVSDWYLIDREIGQGGMGTVYLARDAKHGRQVAIKVVSPEAVSGIGIEQFLKEIRTSANLQHPHILPLYDSGVAAGYPYYVMPYIKDGSLRDRLKQQQRLSLDDTVAVTNGVAAALQHAHEHQVLHCDVKPENVLLFENHAYVADFGIARAVHAEFFEWERQPSLDSSAGTPAYVSPEQASGERNLDARSDVYSLGCMVFEMLTGSPPFAGTSTMQIVAQRFTDELPEVVNYAPQTPRQVSQVVTRAMSLPTQRRFATPTELAGALSTATSTRDAPVRQRLSLLASRAGAWWRRVTGTQSTTPRKRNRSREMLASLKQDLGYAFRTLTRAPGFAVVVILTLGFGIGANSVVFSLMNPYFFRALPFGNAEQLVQLGQIDERSGWDGVRFSLPQYLDYREQSQAFEDMAVYYYGAGNLTGSEGAERTQYGMLSANMFSVLQAQPILGRTFEAGEDGPGGARVVVLGHGLWQRRYGGDRSILGRSITFDEESYTVIGVMASEFNFPFGGVKMWIPMYQDPATAKRDLQGSLLVGRLKPDWTLERARQELNGLHGRFREAYPTADGEYSGISVKPIREALNFAWDVLRITFTLMLGAVVFALVIACANVASLTLARSTSRTGEVAVRTALGASRWRIISQFLTESFLLSAAGGLLGIGLAYLATRAMGPVVPEDLYRVGDMSVDGRVLLFTLAVTLVTPVFFGLAPALTAAKTDLNSSLKEGGRGGWGLRSMRLRRALVVFEVAMAVVVVGGMGLMIRSFLAVRNVDLGFAANEVLVTEVTPARAAYPDGSFVDAYFERARESLAALPGVQTVGVTAVLPLNHELWNVQFARPGQAPATPEDWPVAMQFQVSGDYFDAMRIPLLAGRRFMESDGPNAPTVVMVSQEFADTHWSGGSPVGQPLLFGDARDPREATVIGVVGDVKHDGIEQASAVQIYQSIRQTQPRRRFIVLNAGGDPTLLTSTVRQTLTAIDPNLPMSIRPMTGVVQENTLQWSLSSALFAVLGAAALLLASLGIYGVIAYSVAQRRKEIGLRMALGATSDRIRRGFVVEGLRLSLTGLAIGIALTLAAGQAMASVLFGITPFDPVTLGGVLILFAGVAVLASVVPAFRASRVDPLAALRYE